MSYYQTLIGMNDDLRLLNNNVPAADYLTGFARKFGLKKQLYSGEIHAHSLTPTVVWNGRKNTRLNITAVKVVLCYLLFVN